MFMASVKDLDLNRIQHMLEAALLVMSFVQGRERSNLATDTQLRVALR